ncbi:MAG: hypothetical protein ACW99A_17320 [Candidatus Kariarchaeaceae archaeon]
MKFIKFSYNHPDDKIQVQITKLTGNYCEEMREMPEIIQEINKLEFNFSFRSFDRE